MINKVNFIKKSFLLILIFNSFDINAFSLDLEIFTSRFSYYIKKDFSSKNNFKVEIDYTTLIPKFPSQHFFFISVKSLEFNSSFFEIRQNHDEEKLEITFKYIDPKIYSINYLQLKYSMLKIYLQNEEEKFCDNIINNIANHQRKDLLLRLVTEDSFILTIETYKKALSLIYLFVLNKYKLDLKEISNTELLDDSRLYFLEILNLIVNNKNQKDTKKLISLIVLNQSNRDFFELLEEHNKTFKNNISVKYKTLFHYIRSQI